MIITELVKNTTKNLYNNLNSIKIKNDNLDKLCEDIKNIKFDTFNNSSSHLTSNEADLENLLSFVFAIDTLNFCFWPFDMEYENLSINLKNMILKNKNSLCPENILKMKFEDFVNNIFDGNFNILFIEERYRVLKETAQVTMDEYEGKYFNILEKGNFDCEKILKIIVSNFISFQDHCIYEGKQIFFYKRAQILVGDLYGMLEDNKNLNINLINSENLTCFPDYRVPQVLEYYNIIEYTVELKTKIMNDTVLEYGCLEEMEIRSVMIQIVEKIKEKLKQNYNLSLKSIEIDWYLWQFGEKNLSNLPPHHKVKSIYY